MTTVAYKDGVLAADSQATLGMSVRHQAPVQKIYTPEADEYWEVAGKRVVAFGFAGDYTKLPFLIDVLREGLTHLTKFPADSEVDMAAILVLETRDSYMLSAYVSRGRQELKVYPLAPPMAIGSGEMFAMAAMGIGHSAHDAVQAAMKHDIGTGGDIVVFEVPPAPEVPSKRPPKEEPPKTYTVDEVKELILQDRELNQQQQPDPNMGVPSDSGNTIADQVEQKPEVA